jgi:translation initiation factor IF-3
MSIRDALQRAWDADLDLVEIAPNAVPPVCEICDYGKKRFEKSKAKKREAKNSKQVEMKEVQVSPVISGHDLQTKVNMIKRFLGEGRHVQVTCVFSKRQIMFKDQGMQVMQQITEALKEVAILDKQPTFNEKRLQARYRPSLSKDSA